MKRFVCLVLAAALLLTLSACGKETDKPITNGRHFCTQCGEALAETDKFCGGCGCAVNKLDATTEATEQAATTEATEATEAPTEATEATEVPTEATEAATTVTESVTTTAKPTTTTQKPTTTVKVTTTTTKKPTTAVKPTTTTQKPTTTVKVTTTTTQKPTTTAKPTTTTQKPKTEVKVGFIFLHDENSTFDKTFMDAAKTACRATGAAMVFKTNVSESMEAYNAALELIEIEGCNVIFADSFGHEDYMLQAAIEYPDVQFCTAGGTKAHTAFLDNYQNAYAAIYEGWYLTGIAAGMKLNEFISDGKILPEQAVMGYVAPWACAEVMSAYTAFFLGAKSVCADVTMHVLFIESWYDEGREREAALELIDSGCVMISQYSDSPAAPAVCEECDIPNVGYNVSYKSSFPVTHLVSCRINWTPYFRYMIGCVQDGKDIADDWTGTLKNGAVELTAYGEYATPGTAKKVKEAAAALKAGKLHVFDTDTFTVKGETLTECMADVDADPNYESDTQVIKNGAYLESHFRSAPYFDRYIDFIYILAN